MPLKYLWSALGREVEQIASGRMSGEAGIAGLPAELPIDARRDAMLAEMAAGSFGGIGLSSSLSELIGWYSITMTNSVGDRVALNTMVNTTMQPGGGTLVMRGIGYMDADITIPRNVTVVMADGVSYFRLNTGVVLTYLGERPWGWRKVFELPDRAARVKWSVKPTVVGNNGADSTVRFEWFGAKGVGSSDPVDDTLEMQQCADSMAGWPDRVYSVVSGTSTVITVPASTFVAGELQSATYGYWPRVEIVAGTGKGQIRPVTNNGTNTITITDPFNTAPDSTSWIMLTYTNIPPREADCTIDVRHGAEYFHSRPVHFWNIQGGGIGGGGVLNTTVTNTLNASGTVSSATNASITVAGTPWHATEEQFSVWFYVFMTSGALAGKKARINRNTSNQLQFTANALTGTPSPGDTFIILLESQFDLSGWFGGKLSGVTFFAGSGNSGTLHCVYYHRDETISDRGSSASGFYDLWLSGQSLEPYRIGGDSNAQGWQEDLTNHYNIHVRGGWSNGYTGLWYNAGMAFGNGFFANNLNHNIYGIDVVSFTNGVVFDRCNVHVHGGTVQTNKNDFYINLGLQGVSSITDIRGEGSVRFLFYNFNPYNVPWTLEVRNIELQQSYLHPRIEPTDTTSNWVVWNGAGSLWLHNVRVINTPRYPADYGQYSTVGGGASTTNIPLASGSLVADYWINSYIHFYTGANAGLERKVSANSTTGFTTAAFPNTPASGDRFAALVHPTIEMSGQGTLYASDLKLQFGKLETAFKIGLPRCRVNLYRLEELDRDGQTVTAWENILLRENTAAILPAMRFGVAGTTPAAFLDATSDHSLLVGQFESAHMSIKQIGQTPTYVLSQNGSQTGTATNGPHTTTKIYYTGTSDLGEFHHNQALKFTSGVLNGESKTISSSGNEPDGMGGTRYFFNMGSAYSTTPTNGDTFRIGNTTYTYYLVGKTKPNGPRGLVSTVMTITNCPEVLDDLPHGHFVSISPPFAPLVYNYFDILKGATNQLLEANVPAERMYGYKDVGRPTSAYTVPAYDESGVAYIEGRVKYKVHTFVANDTTPSVGMGRSFKTANSSPTTISQFDDGEDGQVIVVEVDANTTIAHNANIKLHSGANLTGSGDDMIMLERRGGLWKQIAPASVN